MRRVYCSSKKALVYLGQDPNVSFWDHLWQKDNLLTEITKSSRDFLVLPETRKLLPIGSRLLEGGCGTGKYVYSMTQAGYKVVGLDTAKGTIEKVKKMLPQLDVRVGDIRKTKFPDNYFDGYWSIGVIEHFYEGFDKVAAEMSRIIKVGGYLFLTFPYLSPVRQLKIVLGQYLLNDFTLRPEKFYQYALSDQVVIKKFQKYNFRLVKKRSFDGYKGFKEETNWQFLALLPEHLKIIFSALVSPFAAHSILLILQKEK